MDLHETIYVIAAIAAVLVGPANGVPGIIWLIRCSPESRRYRFPRKLSVWSSFLRPRDRDWK
jgi:hypothetical protein